MTSIISEFGNCIEEENSQSMSPIKPTSFSLGLFSSLPDSMILSLSKQLSSTLDSILDFLQQFFIYIHPLIHSCGQYLSVCLREITEEVEDKENGVIDNMMEWHSHYDN